MEKNITPDEAPPPLSVWAKIWGTMWAAVALLTIFTFWQEPFYLTLVSAFRFQLLLGLCLLSLPCLLIFPGKRKLLFVAVPLMIAGSFAGYLIPARSHAGVGLPVSVVMANVYSGNLDLTRLQSWISPDKPDLLGVLEVSPGHQPTLESLGYEHSTVIPRTNNFGLALLSKEKPLNTRILGEESPCPSVLADFESYRVLLMHPPPPVSSELRDIGDQQVELLLQTLGSSEKPTVVMGDFNATGWDLRLLPLKAAGLRDARAALSALTTAGAGNNRHGDMASLRQELTLTAPGSPP